VACGLVLLFSLVAAHTYDSKTASASSEAATQQLDSSGSDPAGTDVAWYPTGFKLSSDPDVAWQWTDNANCNGLSDYCWGILITTNRDCSNVYAQVSIEQNGTVVDYANDMLGAISAGQTGALNFEWFSEDSTTGTASATLTEIDCY
jgi:hypothetical protein